MLRDIRTVVIVSLVVMGLMGLLIQRCLPPDDVQSHLQSPDEDQYTINCDKGATSNEL